MKHALLYFSLVELSTLRIYVGVVSGVKRDLSLLGFSERVHSTMKSARTLPWMVFLEEQLI